MSFIIDIGFVVIIALALIIGWKKGFIRSVLGLASTALAFIGAILFHSSLATYLSNNIFMEKISSFIEKQLNSSTSLTSYEQLFSEKPDAFVGLLNRFSNQADVEKFYNEQVASGADNISKKLADFMAAPISEIISKALAFIIIFFVLLIVLKIVIAILDGICNFPVLSHVNKILGLAFGAVAGLAVVWVLSVVIYNAIPYLATIYPNWFGEDIYDNSVLLTVFYKINPVKLLELIKF